ncbi:MAG: fumarylacetoacetate hydrolase [Actinobacteria bacterium]|nr:fumarylacetoacetate hydrolase [Actinomycetota bacterium]
MQLAVIESAGNPFALTKYVDGKYFAIRELPTLTAALKIPLAELRGIVDNSDGPEVSGRELPPLAPESEVWGAGVTYLRSRDARKEESGTPDVYQKVYEADRPELFFKANFRRTVGNGDVIGKRADCTSTVPEPEVAIVVNCFQEIIGFTICNDVTSRSIEGANPLYLPQAKSYLGSTALGPRITPSWLAPTHDKITVAAQIKRGSEVVWSANTALSSLNKSLEHLVGYLFRCQTFPDGVVLSTGTGIIPPLDFIMQEGDVVTIDVGGVGRLENEVIAIPLDINNKFQRALQQG